MKVQHVTIKGFRNVPDTDTDLNGCNVLLYGDNTVGKSNFIKAIHSLLNAEFQKNSIRTGNDRAEITAVLSDFEGWTPVDGSEHQFRAKIRRKPDGGEEVKIELRFPDGNVETRLRDIRTFIGQVPLQFNFVELSRSEKGKQQQLEIVRSMYPVEFQEELRKLENRGVTAYNERTDVGRDLKNVEGFIAQAGITEQDIKTFTARMDTTALRQEHEKAVKRNQQAAQLKSKVEALDVRIPQAEKEIKQIEKRLKELRNELVDIATKKSEAAKWFEANPTIDTTPIDQQLQQSEQHNQKFERVEMMRGKIKERDELTAQYGELDALVNSTRGAIDQHMREMQPPVPGLSFDDKNVYFNGLLVDVEHMSTAQIMMLEVMLMMCKAKNAQVLFIERGESLGAKMLAELKELAAGSGFQLFLEQVERGTEELRVEIEKE